jgi:predicted SAM-dependent methyltransferase
MTKLHLGCSTRHLSGYVNVDGRAEVNPDVVDDVFKLETFENESVDVIYLSHVLEHTSRQGCEKALNRYYQVLKYGGVLKISVPDATACFEHYISNRDLVILENLLYGKQEHEYDFHYNIFDKKSLTQSLIVAGFDYVKRFDPFTDEDLKDFDDHSKAVLPHMDFENGRLMSLNLQAIKIHDI